MDVVTKRIYDVSEEADGLRILVNGFWPRGRKKETAPMDFWLKEAALSAEVQNAFQDISEAWDASDSAIPQGAGCQSCRPESDP